MDGYLRNRRFYKDVSSTSRLITTTNDPTLISAPSANERIFVQRITMEITTGSATTWQVIDNASVPMTRAVDTTTITRYEFDFGPEGIPCTAGQSLVLNVGATGAAGWVTVEAYVKRTVVAAA